MHMYSVDICVAFILSLSYNMIQIEVQLRATYSEIHSALRYELVIVVIWNLSKRECDCMSGCFKIQINLDCHLTTSGII